MDGRWADEARLRSYRAVAAGRRGAVAAGHPLAAQAGLEVLRRGGNAADAAVAISSTLAVVEPHMSGLGGDGFFLFWDAAARNGTVINASGPAPRAASVERFRDGPVPYGPLAATVPGAIDGWWQLHERFGSLPWCGLFDAALEYARNGYAATRRLCAYVRESPRLADDADAADLFWTGGRPAGFGSKIAQPELARSLETIAAGGSEAFYRGELGSRFVAAARAKGGVLAHEDLTEYCAEIVLPISTTYRGLTVLEAPPNSTGLALLQELNVAERFDLREMGLLSADAIHTLVEIKKLAFVERDRWGADPRFYQVDVQAALSDQRADELAAQVDPRRAAERPIRFPTPASSHTTYYAVVDRWGNAVSGIQSLNDSFGACAMAGETGILLNNRMRYCHLEPGHPNELKPGKRVRHTMNPPMVVQDGQVRIVFGTPGADAQVQTNLQVLTFLVDFDLDPQQAVEAPRWRSYQTGGEANWPHTVSDDLAIEERFSASVREDLAARGHRVQVVGPLDGGCSAQVILSEPDGTLLGGSDPRRDSLALAY